MFAALIGGAVIAGAFVEGYSPGGAHAVSHAEILDACQYFTTSDAQQVLGVPAVFRGSGAEGNCAYTAVPLQRGSSMLSLNVFHGTPLSVAASYDGGAPKRDTSVRDLGVPARWYYYGANAAGVLDVHHGHYVFRVMVGDTKNNRATAIAVARIMIPRLPAT